MQAIKTSLDGVLVLEPKVFGDARGFFMETYNTRVFGELTGCRKPFVQDNHSRSARGVLRGLHYQLPPKAQDKLVRVIAGEILDVAVDLRRGSKTFGKWEAVRLSAESKRELWVPTGFAHGFAVLSEVAEVIYKVTEYWSPEHERCIRWDDADLAIDWTLAAAPSLSARDQASGSFKSADYFP
jgi:dTDP-4-dehydrorhamnose 3,5-epimerase